MAGEEYHALKLAKELAAEKLKGFDEAVRRVQRANAQPTSKKSTPRSRATAK